MSEVSPEASNSSKVIRHFSELIVWQRSFQLSRKLFEVSKRFPVEKRYALTDQLRRSSRSIGANIAEAWAKRRYTAHIVSKLTDADAEAHETEHWLLCAEAHEYIKHVALTEFRAGLSEIGRMVGAMMAKPERFLPRHQIARPDLCPPTSDF